MLQFCFTCYLFQLCFISDGNIYHPGVDHVDRFSTRFALPCFCCVDVSVVPDILRSSLRCFYGSSELGIMISCFASRRVDAHQLRKSRTLLLCLLACYMLLFCFTYFLFHLCFISESIWKHWSSESRWCGDRFSRGFGLPSFLLFWRSGFYYVLASLFKLQVSSGLSFHVVLISLFSRNFFA